MKETSQRRLKFDREVIAVVREIVPDHTIINTPESIEMARKFLAGFLLCQVNSWTYPYSAMTWCLERDAFLNKGIQKFLERSLEVSFDWPAKMQEGIFYLSFNKATKCIAYKVMYKGLSREGEILDEQYKPLKNSLNRSGVLSLSLREVNFLIETIVSPSGHLPYFCEVHDPLSLDYFCDFLESDLNTQKEVLQLLSHLKPFDEFGFEPPTALALDDGYKTNQNETIDKIILCHRLK